MFDIGADLQRAYSDGYKCGRLEALAELKRYISEMADYNDKADRKTEPSDSEFPNNCEKDCFLCKWLGDVDVCGRCRNRNLFAEADTEPQKWEKPPKFDHKGIQTACVTVPMALIEDEPQTEREDK